jgi:hypothetical protein
MTVTVRYEVRYQTVAQADADWMHPGEVIQCARRSEACDKARELARDESIAHVEAWQIGTDGGDAATATGLIWSLGLAEAGLADPA